MTEAYIIPGLADTPLIAHLVRDGGMTWICLQVVADPDRRQWLEFWSGSNKSQSAVSEALQTLERLVTERFMIGPLGPFLKGPAFIPGWDSWGGARPAPIHDRLVAMERNGGAD